MRGWDVGVGEEVGGLELGLPHLMQLKRLVLALAIALDILTLAK